MVSSRFWTYLLELKLSELFNVATVEPGDDMIKGSGTVNPKTGPLYSEATIQEISSQ